MSRKEVPAPGTATVVGAEPVVRVSGFLTVGCFLDQEPTLNQSAE